MRELEGQYETKEREIKNRDNELMNIEFKRLTKKIRLIYPFIASVVGLIVVYMSFNPNSKIKSMEWWDITGGIGIIAFGLIYGIYKIRKFVLRNRIKEECIEPDIYAWHNCSELIQIIERANKISIDSTNNK